jgi:hypothetical protein
MAFVIFCVRHCSLFSSMQHGHHQNNRSTSRNETPPMAQTSERNGHKSCNTQDQTVVVIDQNKTLFGRDNNDSKRRQRRSVNDSHSKQSLRGLDKESILQTRRLTGDASRKGQEWWKICQVNDSENESNKSSIKAIDMYKRKADKMQSQRYTRSMNDQHKVYIVRNKKAQYGHLISNHGEMARDENKRPIIYRRPEQGRKEVAPLWYHPFSTDG